jgi:hypothetical protein
VNDREIDEILARAAQQPDKLEPALLERLADSLKPSLQPVRPLPSTWALVSGLILISAVVALAGAARAGFYGIEKLNLFERALIFPALAVLTVLAGIEFVSEMIPGSRRRVTSEAFLAIGCAVLLCVFAFLFRDYHTDHFVHAGIACLATGVLHAIPAALLSWLLLRRGFAVNAAAAGIAVGTLSGLAGVTMLELHCENFQALHILVWHTGVLLLSGALGALVGWVSRLRRRST